MVSLNHVGFAGVSALRGFCQLPIHGHRNGWGMFSRHPLLGIEFTAWQKLWRAVGVDHLHVNGLKNKFWEPDESVIRSIAALSSRFGAAIMRCQLFRLVNGVGRHRKRCG